MNHLSCAPAKTAPHACVKGREDSRQEPKSCAVEVRGAQVRYAGADNLALEVEHLRIEQGVRTALVGPNGAGKSTLLKAIVGLLPLCGGAISLPLLAGADASFRDTQVRRRVAYVPQSREVDWSFPVTVLDVALMGRDVHLGFAQRPRKPDLDAARGALETLGMSEYSQRPISALSGGQKQRVFLARALAQRSEILLLDEPFIGVDAASEETIFRVVEKLAQEGVTVVVATHDLTTLAANYDRAVLLRRQVIVAGAPAEIVQPQLLAQAYGGPLALFQERDACHHA